jgi:hypothetical protein
MNRTFLIFLALCLCLSACGASDGIGPGSHLDLASFEEKEVGVQIVLEIDAAGQAWLAAIYTPQGADGHLYSMDTPRDGLNGLGRPTLLELIPGSQLQAAGPLTASAEPQPVDGEDGLFAYPAGPVTLRLPVTLPAGTEWVDEQVSVTYMACSGASCSPPVQGKIVAVRVPGAGLVTNP